jgi:predicted lysophospholipase L1 biosynthesis ABC-type transport system permease subunit
MDEEEFESDHLSVYLVGVVIGFAIGVLMMAVLFALLRP